MEFHIAVYGIDEDPSVICTAIKEPKVAILNVYGVSSLCYGETRFVLDSLEFKTDRAKDKSRSGRSCVPVVCTALSFSRDVKPSNFVRNRSLFLKTQPLLESKKCETPR